MIELTLFIFICLLVSTIADRQKTIAGIRIGWRQFRNILPAILNILIIVSIVLFLIPNSVIADWLSGSAGIRGFVIAAVVGSITMIPGFIAYPLCGILLKNGVPYPVLAVFVTTLMMVGIMTLPIESRYFGWKASLLRNALSLIAALMIGLLVGVFF